MFMSWFLPLKEIYPIIKPSDYQPVTDKWIYDSWFEGIWVGEFDVFI